MATNVARHVQDALDDTAKAKIAAAALAEAEAEIERVAHLLTEEGRKAALVGQLDALRDKHIAMMDRIRTEAVQVWRNGNACAEGINTFLQRNGMPIMARGFYDGESDAETANTHCTIEMPAQLNPDHYTEEGLKAMLLEYAAQLATHKNQIRRRSIRAMLAGSYVTRERLKEIFADLGFEPYREQYMHTYSVNLQVLSSGRNAANDYQEKIRDAVLAVIGEFDQLNERDTVVAHGSSLSGPLPEPGERDGWHDER